jgi:hypothetical protein
MGLTLNQPRDILKIVKERELIVMIKVGDKVLFYVNWSTREEKETVGEVKEIKRDVYKLLAYGNYFFLNRNEISPIKN